MTRKHLNDPHATMLLARRLKVLGEPCRMRILCVLLSETSVCVTNIAEAVGESVAVVSHHVRALAREGYVIPVRNGKRVCYELAQTPFVEDMKRLVCTYRS